MTEIEQKAVEEMAENQNVKNIQNIINNAIANNHGIINYKGMSVIYCAIDLHKAHYRPEAEVRAETARDILGQIQSILGGMIKQDYEDSVQYYQGNCEDIDDRLQNIAAEYGKEVTE